MGKPGQQMVDLSAEISDGVGRCNSFHISPWLPEVGDPILPLRGLVAHGEHTYRVQSGISALVTRMLWPGLASVRHKQDTEHRLSAGEDTSFSGEKEWLAT